MNNYDSYISRISQSKTIDNKLIDYIKTSKCRYLYGNGLQTAVCLGIFRDMGLEISGIILPVGSEPKVLKGYWGRLMRLVKKYSMQELSVEERKNAYVMMAIPRSEYKEATDYLEYNGVEDIIGCCWKHNSELNDICYDMWQEKVTAYKKISVGINLFVD